MYWLSEYHAAKRTEYNETLSTELTNNRSADYHELCTENTVNSPTDKLAHTEDDNSQNPN